MRNELRGIKVFIEDLSPQTYSLVLVIPISLYILGFFVWSTYFYSFGLVDDDILKAKFILAGFTFGLVTLMLFSVLYAIAYSLSWLINKVTVRSVFSLNRYVRNIFLNVALILGFFSWFFFYAFVIFPAIPGILGGGQPRALALLVEKDKLPMIESLGIGLGTGATYQTENLCVLGENSNSIYVLMPDRAVRFDKSLYVGVNSLPGTQAQAEQFCITRAQLFASQGGQFGITLFVNSLKNIVRPYINHSQLYFFIQSTISTSSTK